MNRIKISTWQFTALLTVSILATAILWPPTFIIRHAGRDAWIAFIISTLAGILPAALLNSLSSRFPTLNLLQIGEKVLGQVLGKLMGISYVFFFILWTAVEIREFTSFMSTAFMPITPIEILGGIMMLAAIYPAYLGLEVICRLSEIIFPLIILFLLLFILLMTPEMEFSALLPLLQSGPLSLLRASFIFFAWAGQTFLLGMLYPHLEKPEKALSSTLTALAVVGFFLITGTISLQAVFGFNLSERLVYAPLSFVRLINITGLFFERIDALVIVIWIGGVFLKISFLLYLSAKSIKLLFGISKYRPLLLPTGLLSSALSVAMFKNAMELEYYLSNIAPTFFLPYLFGIPLALLLISRFKAPKNNNRLEETAG